MSRAPKTQRGSCRSGARRVSRILACAAVLAGGVAAGCEPGEQRDAGESVYGVQLHVHGSMSEGPASMEAHAIAAAELDGAVDVIWWTDHDWRIAGHTYVDGFDFEEGLQALERVPAALRMAHFDGREPMPDWAERSDVGPDAPPESVESVRTGFVLRRKPGPDTGLRVQVSDREARRGRRSLHLQVDGPPTGRDRIVLGFDATRRRHIASLASAVALRLSVLPVAVEGDVRLAVSVGLSQRRPGERSRIEYVLEPAAKSASPRGAEIALRPRSDGAGQVRVATVAVPTEPGVWNDWVLELTRHATEHGLGGDDNALVDLAIVVDVGAGGRLDAYVDALSIDRARLGAPLFAAERELAHALSDDSITHHVGQEISYAAHLNAYGSDVPLPDMALHPHGLSPRQAVEWVHAHGGVISLAHFFGTEFTMISHRFPRSREAFDASVARLVANEAFGVDLLEVGYRSRGHGLAAFVELWDALSAAGIRVVGVGVSDSHDAEVGWQSGPNNFITWIHADSADEADLLAGLRAGRAFFGDPTRFDGVLDLTTAAGGRMGDRLEVAAGPQHIRLHVEGLRAGQSLRLIRDGQPIARFEPAAESFEVEHVVAIDGPSFVRLEVVEDDAAVVLSNPIHFVLVDDR